MDDWSLLFTKTFYLIWISENYFEKFHRSCIWTRGPGAWLSIINCQKKIALSFLPVYFPWPIPYDHLRRLCGCDRSRYHFHSHLSICQDEGQYFLLFGFIHTHTRTIKSNSKNGLHTHQKDSRAGLQYLIFIKGLNSKEKWWITVVKKPIHHELFFDHKHIFLLNSYPDLIYLVAAFLLKVGHDDCILTLQILRTPHWWSALSIDKTAKLKSIFYC
jgi:hypothetical protein